MSKRPRALVVFGVGALQALMEVIILIADWFSDLNTNPNQPEGALMVSHSLCVLSAQEAKNLGTISVHSSGANLPILRQEIGSTLFVIIVADRTTPKIFSLQYVLLHCYEKSYETSNIHALTTILKVFYGSIALHRCFCASKVFSKAL